MKKITAVLLTIITLFLISSNALALNVGDEDGVLKDGKIKEFLVYDYAEKKA